MQPTFYLGTAFVLTTTIVLGYAGLLQQKRVAGTKEDRSAILAFALWWYGAAAVLLLVALQSLLVIVGVESVEVHNAIRYLRMAPLSIAAGSLLFVMMYLFTGRVTWRPWIIAAYTGFFAFTIYYANLAEPVTLRITAWDVRTVAETPVASGLEILFGVLLAGPILLATISYATLFFRIEDPEKRYRLALLAISFIIWFGAILVGFLLGLTKYDWFPVMYEAPGIVAGILVIMAYRPPRWIQRRLSAASADAGVQSA